MEEWISYKTKLGKSLLHIYPLSKKKTDPTEPEWVTKLEQCGAEQEIRQLGNAYERRTELQQEISRRSKKTNHQARCIRLRPILQSWRQAARYTKEHIGEIQYSRKPIIDITQARNNNRKKNPNKRTMRAKSDTKRRYKNTYTG